MSLFLLSVIVVAIFAVAYRLYGRFLAGRFELSAARRTPSAEINDGDDFVPTKKGFLLGQHFSAIAAAGPIVGPILAGLWFGWLPVLLWIVFGSILIGAMHDFASMVISVRHRGESVVRIVRDFLGPRGHLFFMLFVWLSLLYVIVAFTDLTSGSFVTPDIGGGVATSSVLYLVLGVAMGVAMRRFRMPLWAATTLFVPLVGLSIWYGNRIPLVLPAVAGLSPKQVWNVLLLGYCLVASVIPVWVLLQPRGYLGGFFLYGTLAMGVVGLFMGGERIHYPAFIGFTNAQGAGLFPLLFVTVACGACSGFHGIVSSGTTSKQIESEPDCQLVGYGGMLLEGLVAVIALATVMVLAPGAEMLKASPDRIYAEGLSRFVGNLGIPPDLARSFTLLAFTTFIYDTLDVATRLARYILEEVFGWTGQLRSWVAGVLSYFL
jgi:carbon starvation protein